MADIGNILKGMNLNGKERLQLFLSIGFFTWLAVIALFIAICRKDKAGIMVSVPIFANILSLLIATPVFSEFRYAYSTFCIMPVLFAIVLRKSKKNEETENRNIS